jgi:hypothetical protein
MSHGQYGFDHHKARAENKTSRALTTVGGWCAGRGHLTDEIDAALRLVIGEHAACRQRAGQRARKGAVLALRKWIKTSPHLPADFVAALHVLLPEIGQETLADDWPVGHDEWPD